jgi:predicted nuclease of restriction endonuclease-like (RecB) superfamily
MFPIPPPSRSAPEGYAEWLVDLKSRIRSERLRIVLASNAAMVMFYWDLGRSICEKQDAEGWGARVIDRLAADLREAFPDRKGFSPRNLKYMRAFAMAWTDRAFGQEVLAPLTWYHILALLEKLKAPEERRWYARKTQQHGWSRNILAVQIQAQAHLRHGKAQNNFPATLPRREAELQRGLMAHLQKFLLELEEIEAEMAEDLGALSDQGPEAFQDRQPDQA